MAKSVISFDESCTGIVIVCAEHPYWAAFRFFKTDAWDVAIRHETERHPNVYHQRNAAEQRARHAAKQKSPAKVG